MEDNSEAKPLAQIERHSYSEVGWISRQNILALRSRDNFFLDIPFYRTHCRECLIRFYKRNVKENISPTTGYRPDIQPLYVSTRLWFPSLVALVGRTKACGGSEFLWRSHRRLTPKPIRSETNKHTGFQKPTTILSGTQT